MLKKKETYREMRVEALFEGLRVATKRKLSFRAPKYHTELIIYLEKGVLFTLVRTQDDKGKITTHVLNTDSTVKVATVR